MPSTGEPAGSEPDARPSWNVGFDGKGRDKVRGVVKFMRVEVGVPWKHMQGDQMWYRGEGRLPCGMAFNILKGEWELARQRREGDPEGRERGREEGSRRGWREAGPGGEPAERPPCTPGQLVDQGFGAPLEVGLGQISILKGPLWLHCD